VVQFDQILKGCRQYNKFAQKLLYDMYAPKAKGICLRYVSDPETAKDIVQDGFIKVFSNIKKFDGKGSFEGWIKRIFINTAISHIRKHDNKNDYVNLEEVDESDFLENDIHQYVSQVSINNKSTNSKKENLEIALMSDLSEDELLSTLQRIPEKFRTVFNLFCIEQLKHEEIAEILSIDVTTSRTRLLRARSLIQKELCDICSEKLIQKSYEY
jgi:RNA polymerase sigma-70 factor, ECF subfamily